jgi:site-specific recombinase
MIRMNVVIVAAVAFTVTVTAAVVTLAPLLSGRFFAVELSKCQCDVLAKWWGVATAVSPALPARTVPIRVVPL